MLHVFTSFSIKLNHRAAALLGAFALLGSVSAQAQSQTFSSSTVTPGELTFTATDGSYFTTAGLAGLGAYGVQNGNNGNGTAYLTTLVFNERTIGTNVGNTNKLTFDLASPIEDFDDLSKVEVFVDIDRQGFPLAPQLTITAPTNREGGPTFSFNSPIKPASGFYNTTTSVSMTATEYINRVTISLPSSITTAGIRVSAKIILTAGSKKDNTLLIDNVALTSGVNSPLPVELTSFTATTKSNGIAMNWATASEKNNDRFEVQRSATGESFQTIGTVKGQGNSSSAHAYSFLDASPLAGTAYYRLRQVDTDGKATFSPLATAQFAGELAAYPNPSNGTVTLPAATDAMNYRVLNVLGQAVLSGKAVGNSRLDLTTLPRGTFFLELTGTAGRSTQRLVRE